MAANFPPPHTPETGDEQYRRWVEYMKTSMRTGGPRTRDVTAAATAETPAGTPLESGGDTTLVMDTAAWFLGDDTAIERSVLPRPIVSLSQSHVEAAPGQPVRLKVTVRNVGPVVETYSLSVVGPEGSWLSVVPSEVSLFPGSEGSAALIIKPGRTSKLPSGDYVIGVMARSEVDPHESTVSEVTITVVPFYDSSLNLSRTTIDIRRRATTFAQITNNGNAFVDYRLDVADPDGYLRFRVEDPEFTLAPGDTVWKKITVSAPLHLFGSSRTLSMVASLTAIRDHTSGLPLEEIRPIIQRVTLVQRPAIRFRLGILGRILLLLLIIGLILAFVLSRLGLTGSPDIKTAPPAPPQGLTVQEYEGSQVLLTWQASPGAQGYSIYAVGSTGNALMAAAPSASATPASSASAPASPSASAPAAAPSVSPTPAAPPTQSATPVPTTAPAPTPDTTAASFAALGVSHGSLRAAVAIVRASSDPSPAPEATSNDPGSTELAETDIESPACGDCTHVADVPSGTTRYIVTKTMPGQDNCYRIIATAGASTSLYTPSECTFIAPAAGSASSTSGGQGSGSSTGSDGAAGVCPPYQPVASALTSTSVALTWLPPTDYKEKSSKSKSGKKANNASSGSKESKDAKATKGKKDRKDKRKNKGKKRGFTTADSATTAIVMISVPAGGGSGSGSSSPPASTCNPQSPITGFELQRQLLDGWTTITPAPTANDTAMEVGGLQPKTKYCFRMRSQATPSPSAYTSTFCATTLGSSAASTSQPTPTATATPTPSPMDPTGTGPSPAAAIIIEGVR